MAFTILIFGLQSISQLMLGYDLPLLMGMKLNPAIREGELWRLVTPIFLHVGLVHLGVNMYSLYALGPAVEQFFRSGRMLFLYMVSGVSGVIFSLAFSAAPSVGASGAIFGLLGALGTFFFLHRRIFGPAARLHFRQIAMVAVLNLALGLSPGIDNWGHVGGLLAGVALTWLLGPRYVPVSDATLQIHLQDSRPWATMRRWAAAAFLFLVLLAWLAIAVPLIP
jgi:rhomboid protease GluP